MLSLQDLMSCRQEDGGAVLDPGVDELLAVSELPGPVTVTGVVCLGVDVGLSLGLDEG